MPKAPTTPAAETKTTKKSTKKAAPKVVDSTSQPAAETKPPRAVKNKAKATKAAKAEAGDTKAAKAAKAPKAESTGKRGRRPVYLKPTMEYFASVGKNGSTRPKAREATGNKNLGTPWLVKQGYLEEQVQEEAKEHLFIITDAGKKALKDGEFDAA